MPADQRVDIVTEDVTKDELYEVAKELDISGRSAMTKEQLADAVAQQGGQS